MIGNVPQGSGKHPMQCCKSTWKHTGKSLNSLWAQLNPLSHAHCSPLSHGPWAHLPYNNRADLPKGHELRATVIAGFPTLTPSGFTN